MNYELISIIAFLGMLLAAGILLIVSAVVQFLRGR
jgi:hypothetical protein